MRVCEGLKCVCVRGGGVSVMCDTVIGTCLSLLTTMKEKLTDSLSLSTKLTLKCNQSYLIPLRTETYVHSYVTVYCLVYVCRLFLGNHDQLYKSGRQRDDRSQV